MILIMIFPLYYINTSKARPINDSTQTQQTMPSSSVVDNSNIQASVAQPFNYLSWSDAQAIADKVALARKLGVRGVAVFKFDGGQDPNMWGVLK